jgi:hypothetical protein
MKKIIVSVFILIACVGILNAQNAPTKTTAKTTKVAEKKDAKMVKSTEKQEAKMAKDAEKKQDKIAKTPLNKTGLKKDGTPDMRMKMNKDAKTVPAGPTKKNGTPDMRYKANKKK